MKRWLYVLPDFYSANLCGLWGVGVEVTCCYSASSPLTSGWLCSTRSSESMPPIKQLIMPNSCIPYCINPLHLTLPPTHSLRLSDACIYWRSWTPTPPLLMAIWSRLMFKAQGLSWRPLISLAELWKHRLHFCGLLQTSAPLPHSRTIIATQKPQPLLGCKIQLDGTLRQSFDSHSNSHLPSPIWFAAQWPPPVISCSHISFKSQTSINQRYQLQSISVFVTLSLLKWSDRHKNSQVPWILQVPIAAECTQSLQWALILTQRVRETLRARSNEIMRSSLSLHFH